MAYPSTENPNADLSVILENEDLDQLISKDKLAEIFEFEIGEVPEPEPDEQELSAEEKQNQTVTATKTVEELEAEAEADLAAIPMGRSETVDAVGLYLKEMSRVPLLNNVEEVDLAKRIERAMKAQRQLKKLSGRAATKSRQELGMLIQDGHDAREHLIKANTRLVVSIAKRYMSRGVPFLDLIQEGNLGLMKAVNKYDYRRGFRFSTYATWWIRQTITRAIADQGRTIRVPVHMIDRIRLMYKTARQLEQKLGRPPKVEELSEALEMDVRKVQWMLKVSWLPLSLESPVGDEDDSELGMFVEDEKTPSPGQSAYQNMLGDKIEEILETLSPREARILRLRFGLDDGRQYTLEEVGERFGLTRERIRQIEGKALRRLRHPVRARQLREYL